MVIQGDWSISRFEDGALVTEMAPSESIVNWSIQVDVLHRFGGVPLFSRYMASGLVAGQSGITVNDAGAGIFTTVINSPDTSGIDAINLAFQIRRTDSGNVTNLSKGYLVLG